MKLQHVLKTTFTNSVTMSLVFGIVFAPTLSYAADAVVPAPATPTAQSPASLTPEQLKALQFQAELLNRLKGTSKTQVNNFNRALSVLEKGDAETAKKYLLNGMTASARAGILDKDLIDEINLVGKATNGWLDVPVGNSNISNAINGATQQAPTAMPIPSLPTMTDFPGTLPLPAITTPGSSISGLASSDEQIKKLNDLMISNPELRTLLWQTAQQRLGATAADIGINPPSFTATTNPIPSSFLCSPYYTLCSIINGGGLLAADFTPQMTEIKNRHYGVPLDELAEVEVIRPALRIAALTGISAGLVSVPAQKNQIPGGWIGQTTVDITPPIAMFYVDYTVIGQLAALYNYPLNASNKGALSLIGLAMVRAVGATAHSSWSNLSPVLRDSQFAKMPYVGAVIKTLVRAKRENIPVDRAMGDMLRKNPLWMNVFQASLRSWGVPMPNARVTQEERTTKEKPLALVEPPANPNGPILDPTGGTGGANPPGPNFPPGPDSPSPGPDKPPRDPGKGGEGKMGKGGILAAIGLPIIYGVASSTYNVAEAELLAVLMKTIFKGAYMEERRMESEKFRNYMLGITNTKFLKLLILSQSPESLRLAPLGSPTTQTQPTIPTPPFPTTKPDVKPNPTAPAPIGSAPTGSGPTGPGPLPFKVSTDSSNPNSDLIPFDLTIGGSSNSKNPNRTRFGGNPADFILNYARSMRICSQADVEKADEVLPKVQSLLAAHPELSKYNTWDEARVNQAKGMISSAYGDIKDLILFFKNPQHQENVFTAVNSNLISTNEAKNILLLHDCYGRVDSTQYKALLKEMITFTNFTDEDISDLRQADAYVRLRMGEVILQLLYLNAAPDDKASLKYFKNVQKILALDSPAYTAYYHYYSSELNKSQFVPYAFSPTGYRLRNLSALNPYDMVLAEERRPDEPQVMQPIAKPGVNPNGINGGFDPSYNPGGSQIPGGTNGWPFFWSGSFTN